ncbi:MAG: 2Fe-2S iron-sulfur cluster-binding protein, partial [Arenicellales bacterium]|nr:2Fe-2S iron-sulfur cluster-binding protein [Arenicellales bacterium]
MSTRRLATGGLIDRSKPITFSWDGKKRSGYSGDTLASALIANGDRVVGRSFKYHRPRGVMSAGVEESGAIVTVGAGSRTEPNVKATVQELYDGLVARGQNAWPSVRFDLGSVSNLLGRFFAAGFYYKTFMGIPPLEWGSGTGMWMRYERIIRKAAGMGEASRLPDPDHYEHAHAFCDVLVVGAGPAGIAAARATVEAGLDVVLVEQDSVLGGTQLSTPSGGSELIPSIEELESMGVRVMTRTTAFGLYDYSVAGLVERVTDHLPDPPGYLPRHRFWTLRAKYTIVAAGAIERHIAFGNNDRPGVMTAAAVRTYVNRFAVLPGENIIIATNNDSVYEGAVELSSAGAQVTLLDARSTVSTEYKQQLTEHNIEVRCGMAPLQVQAAGHTAALEIASVDGDGWRAASTESCDLVAVSGGWSPVVNLLSHRGVKPVWDSAQACFLAVECAEPVSVAGSAAGVWNSNDCVASGQAAAGDAIQVLRGQMDKIIRPPVGGWQQPIQALYEVKVPGRKLKSFVDPQHDV